MKIAVVVGSTRPGRVGLSVAEWVHEHAAKRSDADFELLDLKPFGLVLLEEETVPGAANRQYERAETRAWSEAVDRFDGFIWVSPEYNHGVPAALKNAFDVLYPEWNHKAFGIVGYGADCGVRATEHWRQIIANARGVVVRAQVSLSSFHDWTDGVFTPDQRRVKELTTVLDQVVQMTEVLAPLSQPTS